MLSARFVSLIYSLACAFREQHTTGGDGDVCVCVGGGALTFYAYNLGFIIFDHHFCGGFRKITFLGGRCFFHFIW